MEKNVEYNFYKTHDKILIRSRFYYEVDDNFQINDYLIY